MPVRVAQHSGYCAGVRRAMDQALAAAEQAKAEGLKAYSLGSLIHNPLAMGRLEEAGMIRIIGDEDPEEDNAEEEENE